MHSVAVAIEDGSRVDVESRTTLTYFVFNLLELCVTVSVMSTLAIYWFVDGTTYEQTCAYPDRYSVYV